MILLKAIVLFMAILTSLMYLHDFVGNMLFLYKDDYRSIHNVYPFVPSFFWALFYLIN